MNFVCRLLLQIKFSEDAFEEQLFILESQRSAVALLQYGYDQAEAEHDDAEYTFESD